MNKVYPVDIVVLLSVDHNRKVSMRNNINHSSKNLKTHLQDRSPLHLSLPLLLPLPLPLSFLSPLPLPPVFPLPLPSLVFALTCFVTVCFFCYGRALKHWQWTAWLNHCVLEWRPSLLQWKTTRWDTARVKRNMHMNYENFICLLWDINV